MGAGLEPVLEYCFMIPIFGLRTHASPAATRPDGTRIALISCSRRPSASGYLLGPIALSGPRKHRRPPGGSRAAFAYVVMTSAYAALVPILRVPRARGHASTQDEGRGTAMGKLLADDRRFRAEHRDARPHGRLGRRDGELVLDAGEIHQFLSAVGCMALGRAAQGKVWAPPQIFDFCWEDVIPPRRLGGGRPGVVMVVPRRFVVRFSPFRGGEGEGGTPARRRCGR